MPSDKYLEQLKIEKLNKDTIERVIKETTANDFISFYIKHTQKETMEYFNIRTTKLLRKILKLFNYDFSTKKESPYKGKPSTRSHESYIEGGKKSALTQKISWENKTQEEKDAWSLKQSLSHLNSPTFKDKITLSNRKYRNSLTQEEKDRQDMDRSCAMKEWWNSLSEEERQYEINKRLSRGAGYKIGDSGPNKEFKNKLEFLDINYLREQRLDNYSYDFKVDNTFIEINPTVTHNTTYSPFPQGPLDKNYHLRKTECANKYGYRCIHIWDWDNKDKILNMLKSREIIYARKCIIKEISKEEAKNFINLIHTQDYSKDNIRIGLYYNNELVSVMTFGKPRYNNNYEWELVRFCSSKNIVGGSEKLFKYFLTTYNPTSIVSYCDLSKFTGDTYLKLGFSLLRKSRPTKHWYNIKTKLHITDNLLRQQGFDHLFGTNYGKGTSNEELMLEHGFVEVYDCGQATYIYKK